MIEKYEFWEENKCRYDLYVKSCRQCLFETLCRLEKQNSDKKDFIH